LADALAAAIEADPDYEAPAAATIPD